MNSNGKREVIVTRDADALAGAAANRVAVAAENAIAARGRFTLVLSGGSTPEKLYKLLAAGQCSPAIDWSRTWLFFGDERHVPHDDARSNFRLAEQSLFATAAIEPAQQLPIPTEFPTPAECAAQYERDIKTAFSIRTEDSLLPQIPQFDMILLGLGDDGHTASLFPNSPALEEKKAWVTWSNPGVLPPPVDRITLTLPVLCAAREAMFLVAGANKAGILRAILEGPVDVQLHPASGVQLRDGRVTWLVDEAAAGLLQSKTVGE